MIVVGQLEYGQNRRVRNQFRQILEQTFPFSGQHLPHRYCADRFQFRITAVGQDAGCLLRASGFQHLLHLSPVQKAALQSTDAGS